MSDNPTNPAFQVGICMAGAVSAGAYTAGVMDYLLEALTAYEEKRGKDGFPSHKVEIPVMGGASAGGMTAIITAAALQQGITPITMPLNDPLQERPENILYHSWVDLTGRDMFSKMLDNSDIGTDVVSALNCQFIDGSTTGHPPGRDC
jgi:predicted acylesterase/phospholipase RssA